MDWPIQHFDITTMNFDEFVEFIFDREVVSYPKCVNTDPDPWYWHADVAFDFPKVAAFYVQLFSKPEFLLTRYTPSQLEQGFWAIPSSNIECSVAEIIWAPQLPFAARESCVRAMYELYARLFAKEPLESAANMWWDSLCYDWHCGIRSRSNGREDREMQDVMFETLLKILDLPQRWCKEAALHGLGHLHHPATKDAIDNFLAKYADLDSDLKDYSFAAARFEVM